MQQRKLGTQGLTVSSIGLGCMGLTPIYGAVDEGEAIATVHRAIDLGVNFFDSSDAYAFGANEERLAKAFAGKRQGLIIATKFGQIRHQDGSMDVSGKADYVIAACEASLKRLKIDVIDLYYQHRVDTTVPIEETIGAMARLKEQGKVRFLGLSEAAPETIKRAAKVAPIAALQTEYSLWTRDVEVEILPTCRALGIAFVAYSPLGRGFLSATIKSLDTLEKDDRRRAMPRYQGDNLTRNLGLLDPVERIAKAKDCTPAAVAIAWTMARGTDIVPIPGTKRRSYLEQNVAADRITLSADDMAALERAFPAGAAVGERYPAEQMKRLGL
jgi:aryl-alcohol dehydrogenase-like predicted oxidoreductase